MMALTLKKRRRRRRRKPRELEVLVDRLRRRIAELEGENRRLTMNAASIARAARLASIELDAGSGVQRG